MAGARRSLFKFRRGSLLAVSLTAMLMLVIPERTKVHAEPRVSAPETSVDTEVVPPPHAEAAEADVEGPAPQADEIGRVARDTAMLTVRRLWRSLLHALPKILVALGALALAWGMTRLVRWVARAALGRWERGQAAGALLSIGIWIFAVGMAFSVLSGDLRALVGSVGLVGLALSWALQAPIESFTGWLFNSFRGHYRRGDRILVGDVFGDVYKIDLLTTTVWEIGSPARPGHVHAEQPTGRLVTFPNSEILTGTVTNLTRELAYVWDELAVPIANESDLRIAATTIRQVAKGLLGDRMQGPARSYAQILARAGIEGGPDEDPQVFVLPQSAWTDVVVRYLVGARERRLWKSELYLAVSDALRDPALAGKVLPAYPRRQIQIIDSDGAPVAVDRLCGPAGSSRG